MNGFFRGGHPAGSCTSPFFCPGKERAALFRLVMAIVVLALALSGCSGKTKEELYAEGVKQLKKANPNGAIVLLKYALEKDQNFTDARYQLAKAYMAATKYEQAEKEFQKVLLQDPSRSPVKMELAKLYNFMKKPDLAIKEADDYLTSHPGAPDALEAKGTACALGNKLDDAEGYLQQTLKADPSRTSAKLELAAVNMVRGKEAEVRRLLDEVRVADPKNSRANYMLASLETSLGHSDTALEIYRKISEYDKSDVFAQYKAGVLYIQKGETATAEKIAADLVKTYPKRAEGPRLKGLIYYSRKNFPEAITELQNSIKMQPTIEAYYFLGLSLYNQGDLESALSQFRTILDHSPSFQRARLITAMILLKQQRIEDSIAESKKIIDADPKDALAHNILGSAYMARGSYDEGMKELNRATEIDPKIIDAHLNKGIFHLSKGREKEAETDLQTAVKVAPDVLNTRMILVTYYMRQKNYAKAMATLNQGVSGKKSDAPLYNAMAAVMFAQNRQAEALTYLQKAKEIDPAFLTASFNLASYYAANGEHEKALNECRDVLRKDPQNVKAMLTMAALLELKGRDSEAYDFYKKAQETKNGAAFLALAQYHMKKKEAGKALAVLDEAVKAIPRNTAALEMRGRILVEEKKFSEALKAFDDIESIAPDKGIPLKIKTYVMMKDIPKAQEEARRIITLKPNSAYGYIMLASVYESQNELGRAIDEMKNGLRVDGNNVQAILTLGNLYAVKKDYAAAMTAYGDALRKNPDFAPAVFAQGALLDQSGRKKEAVKKYREALEKSEGYLPALNNLAYLCADGYGSPQEALRLALACFRLDPGNPGVMDTVGYVLLKNGRKADALKVLEKAASLLPGNPTVAYHLALAYKENGTRDLAVKTLQRSLTLGDFPEAASARKLLAELK